jgi:C1A family cysteine protease
MTQVYYDHSNGKRYFMGCNRDPPHADAKLLLTRKQQAELPSSYTIIDGTPVEDQGNEGSCTGNAGDNASKIRSYTATGNYFNGARQQIYQCALAHDGNPLQDVGSSLSTIAWVLENIGVAVESEFPYTGGMQGPVPANVLADAAKDKTTKATRLDASDENTTIANIKTAIAPNSVLPPCYPVMYGYTVFESFFNTGSDGNMPAPSGGVAGGHANVFIAFDDNHTGCYDGSKGAFLSKNSWGTGFGCQKDGTPSSGNGGYWWMPYSYFLNTDDGVGDCWAIITESDFVTPIPTPTPTPNPATPTSCFLTCDTATPKVGQLVTFTAEVIANGKAIPVPVTIYHYLNGVKYVDKFAYSTLTFQTTFESAAPRPYYVSFAGNSTYGSSSSGLAINVA